MAILPHIDENAGGAVGIVHVVAAKELDAARLAVRKPDYNQGAHKGFDGLLHHFIAFVAVRLQLVDFDCVILVGGDALPVGAVPEDGDRAPRVQRQLVVSCDLYQFGGLDRLAARRGDLEGSKRRLSLVAVLMVESYKLNEKR
jgi:hypothetical protein